MEIVSNVENVRIDKYLSDNTEYSREFIQKLIENNLILVNDKKIKASYKVEINDKIIINDKNNADIFFFVFISLSSFLNYNK